jgi:hypothetical protein
MAEDWATTKSNYTRPNKHCDRGTAVIRVHMVVHGVDAEAANPVDLEVKTLQEKI